MRSAAAKPAGAALVVAALGVVFGDIGTSPLYALQTVFSIDRGDVHATPGDVFGIVSLVFWSITLVVSVKYVTFILRADNEGEGGIMALTALLQGTRARVALYVGLGIFGASLFYGDGVITPAISVLSAVEGLKVVSPSLSDLVVPIAVTVLTLLFLIQRWGTQRVGGLFGPVMVVWFTTLAVAGLGKVAGQPSILKGLSPSYAVSFIVDRPGTAFVAMGAVVLAITGAEALYADMGHFGRRPIRLAWFALVFPALTLNYLGQSALILDDPSARSNPFFLLLPHWSRIPMIVLATMATVIASQSVISGAFSVSRQAVQLGFLPRLHIRHTSEREIGQIYVPFVNWALFVAVVVLVVGFQTSASLANAYGIAVTGTFLINTTLFLAVAHRLWHWSRARLALAGAVFLTVEILFFAANLTKVVKGGWLPLLVAAVVFVVLTTWRAGSRIVTARRAEEEGPLQDFVHWMHEQGPAVQRVRGTAVFLNPSIETTPLALRANVEHNHVLHHSVVIVSVETATVPHVPLEEKVRLDDLGYSDDGITHVTVRSGFQDHTSIPRALALAEARGLERDLELSEATYFLSHIRIVPGSAPGLRWWRKRLFVALSRNAASPVQYFGMPDERTIYMGSQIEL